MPQSTTESNQWSDTGTNAPGQNIRGGILNDLFGINQRLSGGTLVAGDAQPYIPMTAHEIRAEIKKKGGDPIGWQDSTRNTPELQARRDAQFAEIQEKNRLRHLQQQGVDVSGQFSDRLGSGTRGGGIFGSLGDLLTQKNPFESEFLGITQQAARDQQDLFGLGNEALRGFLEEGGRSGIDAMVNRGLTDIKEQFSSQGQLFSSDLNDQVIRNRAEQEAMGHNRMLAAIDLAGGQGANQLQFGSGLLDVGQQYNQVATQGGRELGFLNALLGDQSANFFDTGGFSSSGGWSKATSGDSFGDFAGGSGVTGTFDLGGGKPSDIRLKENIERTGETASGIPTYTFQYKDGCGPLGRYKGVMAQDLLEIQPDAVAEMPNGYLGVYYSRIDADFGLAGDPEG